jgi:Flp pilus assembly protein TadG
LNRWFHFRRLTTAAVGHLWSGDHASQIVEFAVSLPLLVVFVVGIFDFSGAFTLKQKLANAARDAARTAAADPASDLTSATTPASVGDAFQVVDNYLIFNKINDCGINPGGVTPVGLTWTLSGTLNGCPSPGLIVTINRGYYFPQTGATVPTVNCVAQAPGGQVAVVGTCVSIQYAYQWRFNRVIGLLVGGTTYAGISTISTTAVALNEN